MREYYPAAWQHLQNAHQAKSALGSLWSSLLDGDSLFVESVSTDPDGSGIVSVFLDWPPGQPSELTDLFRTCVQELWACLDALVLETVEAFSVLHHPTRKALPRFFPVADEAENFQALLAESCMDGTLRSHVAMVEDCQPYQASDGDEIVDRLRRGLQYLLGWDSALEPGGQIGVWVTPVEPHVRVATPVVVDRVEATAPGELNQERVLAHYWLTSYEPGCTVSAQAGTYLDMCFTNGFAPADTEDTFGRRLSTVVEVVTRFAVSFAWLSSRAPGSRRVLPTDGPSESEAWVNVEHSARRWSAEELAELATSDIGLGRVRDSETLTLIVNTPDGVYERTIPRVSPLRAYDRPGKAAEIAVEHAAATWGLPDFVLLPQVERKGSKGVREISDGLLVVGDRGVVVQVKAREVGPGTPQREAAWTLKQITEASKQIRGTVRRLKSGQVQMVNGRGRSIRIDGPATTWVGVAIIEHPDPPRELATPEQSGGVPVIALLRRDWEFLFNQLRSTHAVVGYLHRVASSAPLLGGEPERYYELAAADAKAPPDPLDPAVAHRGGERRSVPLLPAAPAGSGDNEAHTMVRIMLEDVATSISVPDEVEFGQRVLASLDSLPVGYHTELGRLLLDGLSTVSNTAPGSTQWRMRTFISGPGQDQLGFAVCSAYTGEIRAAFSTWLQLRHHERDTSTDGAPLTSVGVLLTPRTDGYRDWDTTMVAIQGDLQLREEDLSKYRDLWNKASDEAAPPAPEQEQHVERQDGS